MERAIAVLGLDKFKDRVTLKHVGWIIVLFKLVIAAYFVYLLVQGFRSNAFEFGEKFLWFILAGFVAQLVDGALGMAYGVSCTSLLLWFGIPPKFASASVHTSEIFTTGVSGLSHIRFANIDKKLFLQIVVTGSIGAIIGAYLIADLFNGNAIKPYISAYLLLLGVYLLYRAFKKKKAETQKVKHASLLAFFGGLLDAIGGGGWGPIVTSNLLSQGKSPRHTIGTVNTAEFFVTYFATAVFIFLLGVQHLEIVLGLIIGGVVAAPLGALVASRINQRILLILVGILVVLTSSWGILSLWL
ncbi:sulfite exporter TauE/SafE family protein [Parapedobacter sp. SGR-10]|uniref:sulfite exporter TauE/SafE family protein n=1 Tax=Parapedobacter sp. SGR-10 TaxID=2710879 RepID=UPI0013CFA363|nr:sulfite exporter TauE/SafE family protein [Parapedobacter sp. SGR-10]NGF56478.1 sulfite exporter TauE/SafE family protein [Parapedobacter sp. SGR-10]